MGTSQAGCLCAPEQLLVWLASCCSSFVEAKRPMDMPRVTVRFWVVPYPPPSQESTTVEGTENWITNCSLSPPNDSPAVPSSWSFLHQCFYPHLPIPQTYPSSFPRTQLRPQGLPHTTRLSLGAFSFKAPSTSNKYNKFQFSVNLSPEYEFPKERIVSSFLLLPQSHIRCSISEQT